MTETKTQDADKDSPARERPAPTTENGSAKPQAAEGRDPESESESASATESASESESESVSASASGADSEAKGPPLLARGNPLRRVRGGVTAGVGGVLAFLLMAHNGQLSFGVPLGLVFVAVAAWGIMDLLGTFDDEEKDGLVVANTTTFAALQGPVAYTVLSFGAFAGCLWGGQGGIGPQLMWGALVTITFLMFVHGLFRIGQTLGPWAKDEVGRDRPLMRRHGFWVVASGALLYFPMMGSYSLWDPWETHYGEVAREILARDDWVSLWWAQDGWFWSKPILNFWMQSLSMASLGTHYKSDMMMTGLAGHMAHPEWVVRAPNVLLTILAMYLMYKGVAKVFGRRAGMLGAFVLATTPDWFFLAHQTMTDMPFVAAMTAAMGLLMLGLNTDEELRTRLYQLDVGPLKLRLSGWHLAFGTILLCAIPQILYLASRNLDLVLHGDGPHGFRAHYDEFRSGSAGNCGLPGNEACNVVNPASIPKGVVPHPVGLLPNVVRLFGSFEPIIQAIVWSIVAGGLLYINWGERRVRRLYYIAAWFFAAIATMGKGPAGFGIPIICVFAYLATKKRWSELLKVEMLSGLLVILCVAIPWWVAMYVRHGPPFTDRIIFHDMFNRAFNHVHDTNEGDDTSFRFYLWQLGYALFPWTGLAPLGLVWWARRSDSADQGRGDASVFLAMWFVFGFALFSFMGTKFHHYIFPAVPPAAMLVGVVLSDMIGDRTIAKPGRLAGYLAGVAAGLVIAVVGVVRYSAGSIFGTKDAAAAAGGNPLVAKETLEAAAATRDHAIGIGIFILGVVVLVACVRALRASPADDAAAAGAAASASPDAIRRRMHERMMVGGGTVAGAFLLLLVVRDLATKPDGADQPGAIRLLQLFTYNYRRSWPETLDFAAILAGFGVVSIVILLAIAVVKVRHHAVAAMLALGGIWSVWGVDVYMTKTAPHWGQHEVIEAYYVNRQSADEPLVAYQMNWKGENFYTGNHIPAFVSSGATFTNWMKTQREKGVKVMYFVTEHSRTGGLRSEVGGKAYREITDRAVCNKFVLVRAEL
jgi:4-amino-4-deoxy-L-arabinose transferase-like glycosyltransferase